jgi:uncharacterized OB-fold protein
MGFDLSGIDLGISPGPDASEFWAGCEEHELRMPRCNECRRTHFYPRSHCPSCGSSAISWETVSGLGTLHAFCIHHVTPIEALRPLLPFTTGLVELDEGPRVMALLSLPPDPSEIRCGQRLKVDFSSTASGRTAFYFTDADESGSSEVHPVDDGAVRPVPGRLAPRSRRAGL